MSYPKIKKGMGGSNGGKNRYDRTSVLKKISRKKRRMQSKQTVNEGYKQWTFGG